MKKWDFDKHKKVKFRFYSQEENPEASFGDQELDYLYTARAKPPEYRPEGSESREIVPGVNVRLNHPEEDGDHYEGAFDDVYENAFEGGSARQEARKCYARVKRVSGYKVELTDCTEGFKERYGRHQSRLIEAGRTSDVSISNKGNRPNRPRTGTVWNLEKGGFERSVDISKVQPLTPSRGKAGGMNHALEVLDEHLVNDSKKELFNKTTGNLFFAVFDCRHMGQQGFWEGVIPHFFQYKDHFPEKCCTSTCCNAEKDPEAQTEFDPFDLKINDNVMFVQLPQTFAGLTLMEDFFDMRNEYGFRMSNTIRSGVGAVTSCGTNAVWSLELEDEKIHGSPHRRVVSYRFNTDTMIEDTASSHDAILNGQKSVYHFDRKVLGARKGSADYLAAVFRWSQGAVQLFCASYFECPRCCARPSFCSHRFHIPCFKPPGKLVSCRNPASRPVCLTHFSAISSLEMGKNRYLGRH